MILGIRNLVLGMMVFIVLGDNCPYEECYCAEIEILCISRNLKVIPRKLINNSPLLTSLFFDDNEITTIPAGSLPGNLSEISFQSNPIETIDDTAFDESIYTLQKITFSEARFIKFPQAVFHLKALKSLYIYETNILIWNEDGMSQFGSTMETLSLDKVELTEWPSWMKSMTNLTQLTLSECSLSIIPDDGLDMMANSLTSLDLSKNYLTSLPKSMSKLTTLSTLTLNNNRIIDVSSLPQPCHLNSLSLDNNKIRDAQNLSNVLRPCANTLRFFDIQNNSLTSIPELSFLTQIPYLNFDFNYLSDANSGSFPSSLTELQIENNLFPSIPSILKNLKLLSQLYLYSNNIQIVEGILIPTSVQLFRLSFNSISQLTHSSFPNNSNLNLLSLNNNPLSVISPDAFNNIPFLTQLNLGSTKLTRLPLALASLTKLFLLDVSDSKNLVCTCQEQNLRPWVQSIGSYSIIGDCGVTNIYFFFATLSLECPQIV